MTYWILHSLPNYSLSTEKVLQGTKRLPDNNHKNLICYINRKTKIDAWRWLEFMVTLHWKLYVTHALSMRIPFL